MSLFDTIVAPITGLPPAAVAWVRISGPESWAIASTVFHPWPKDPEPRRAIYGRYGAGDDGLALPFRAESSYTGEDSVELSMHGSRASISHAVEACIRAGARLANPGEFTQRAFLNGRLDLTEAEGVRDCIEAETEMQLRAASRNREGALCSRITEARFELIKLLAALEASVDFSEEIGEFNRDLALARLAAITKLVDDLIERAASSRILREGYRIAIVGPPNAGKSSLLNALLGMERSIVTPIPGTTRDYIEERADFGGVPVVLTDTAGLREPADSVESIGIERSLMAASSADAVWYVIDSTVGLSDQDRALMLQLERPITVLANKSDLAPSDFGIAVSALTGAGLPGLIESISILALHEHEFPTVNRRQEALLSETSDALADLKSALESDSPDELLSVLLNEAISSLGQITGETADAEMIDRIFADFCIGK